MISIFKLRPCLQGNSFKLSSLISINKPLFEQTRLAGHAKWQNIKSTKQANDNLKAKTNSRYVVMVKQAIVRNGMQTDPKINTKLRDVLTEASRFNVPKATLERAITRALNMKLLPINIEIVGPEKATLVVRCESENVGNMRRDVKKLIRKFDANIAPEGSLIGMFKSRGFVRVSTLTKDKREISQDYAEEAAIMSNAEEVYMETFDDTEDESLAKQWVFETDAENLNQCRGSLEKYGMEVVSSDLDLVPYRYVEYPQQTIDQIQELVDVIREHEQVLDVYHNAAPKNPDNS